MLRLLSARAAVAILAGLAAGTGGGFALADAVGGSIPAPTEKAGALARMASVATTDANTEPAPVPNSPTHPIPGQMLGANVPVPIAPSVLRPSNAWLASDGKNLVAVYAGAAGDDASVGRVVVVRQDLVAGKQRIRMIDAGSSGRLTIVTAPLGSAVETAAQAATLRLRTAGGRLLTLDLGTGQVSHDAHKARLP